jgi:AcrR family transcriptional regulator
MTNLPSLATNVTTAHIIVNYVSSVNISDTMMVVPEKPYHHGSLDQALVEAGMEAVRAVGISKLSLRELARAIGVSSSATYRHFPSREYFEMRVSQRCREALALAMNEASSRIVGNNTKRRSVERFEAIGRAYVQFAVSNPTVLEAAFTRNEIAIDRPDDPSAWIVLAESIEQMIDAGAIPSTRRGDAPIIAWSGVHGIAKILTSSIWPAGVSADQQIDSVITGITRSIK